MDKKEFILALMQVSNYSEQQCLIVNDILEDHFIFRKKNKTVIASCIQEKLELDQKASEELTEQALSILYKEIKNAIRHPFKKRK